MELSLLPNRDSDAERRYVFIRWTRSILNAVSTERRLMVGELMEPARRALNEINGTFEDLAVRARELDEDVVAAHGLGGAQLEFKLATVRHWTRQANAVASNVYLVGKWRDLIRRLLIAIDTILDSILKALRMGSSVKEIKDAILSSIKDADDNGGDD